MSTVSCADDILRINYVWVSLQNIFLCDHIHVVNYDPVVNIVAWNPKVASSVANDYVVAEGTPLRTIVENLINPTVPAKCLGAYRTIKLEVIESFLESR